MSKPKFEPKFLTPEFTIRFLSLVEPSDRGKYNLVAVFDPGADLTQFKTNMSNAIKNKWGDDIPADLHIPLKTRDQETKPENYPENTLHCTLGNTKGPGDGILLTDRDPRVAVPADKFYPGCRARAVVHCYAYDSVKGGAPGVTMWLDVLQFVDDGERLSGGVSEAMDLLNAAPLGAKKSEAKVSDDPLDFLK